MSAGPAARPQDPKGPFPYSSEDVFFTNSKAGITLAGTVTSPKSTEKYPLVVLISGSGAQNRNGIAVLRYDDRGVEQSEGDFSLATSGDLKQDAEAGMLAPIIAAEKDIVDFIVMLTDTGMPDEYGQIYETLSPEVMEDIRVWIHNLK